MKGKSIIFSCNWSTYPGFQFSSSSYGDLDKDRKFLITMCAGRISAELILEAFNKGAQGVLITACPEDKCEHNGNYKTFARVTLTKALLRQMGVNPQRLQFEWIDKGETAKLKNTIDTFVKDVAELCQ